MYVRIQKKRYFYIYFLFGLFRIYRFFFIYNTKSFLASYFLFSFSKRILPFVNVLSHACPGETRVLRVVWPEFHFVFVLILIHVYTQSKQHSLEIFWIQTTFIRRWWWACFQIAPWTRSPWRTIVSDPISGEIDSHARAQCSMRILTIPLCTSTRVFCCLCQSGE